MNRRLLPLLLLVYFASEACTQSVTLSPFERVQEAAGLVAAADSAMDAAAFAEAAELYDQALALRPLHPTLLLRSAAAHARADEDVAAIDRLRQFAELGIVADLRRDSAVAMLPDLPEIEALIDGHRRPTGEVDTAFSWSDRGFAPEGIAVGPSGGRFFVSGVRRGDIVVYEDAEVGTLVMAPGWSLFGLAADSTRLYAAAQTIPLTVGGDTNDIGRSAILSFDLVTGTLIDTFAPADTLDHAFGDLAVLPGGDVLASDGYARTVWRLDPDAGSLTPVLPINTFPSPQGIAVADGVVYVADYSTGVHAVDVESARLQSVAGTEALLGIDGLAALGGDLIAVQNGVRPYRVLRLRLSERRLESAEVLLANDPRLGEPTTVATNGNTAYVVANAAWPHFGPDGTLDETSVPEPLILRLRSANP